MYKILHIEFSSGYGGSFISLQKLLKNLDNRLFASTVLFISELTRISKDQFPCCEVVSWQVKPRWHESYYYPLSRSDAESGVMKLLPVRKGFFNRLLFYFFEFLKLINDCRRLYFVARKQKFALFHINNEIYSHFGKILAARLLGVPVICHPRSARVLTGGERFFSRWVSAFIVLTEHRRDTMAQYLPKEKIFVASGDLELEDFSTTYHPKTIKAELGIPENARVVGIIGNMMPGKGHEIFLKAAQLISRELPQAHFVILGKDITPRKNQEEVLRSLVKELGLEAKTHFLGWQKEIARYLCFWDLSINPSFLEEGLGNVLIESWAAGVPWLASDLPVFSEVLGDSGGGALVPGQDPQAYARKALEILKDEEKRKAMIKAGLKRCRDFTARNTAQKISRLYKRLLKIND